MTQTSLMHFTEKVILCVDKRCAFFLFSAANVWKNRGFFFKVCKVITTAVVCLSALATDVMAVCTVQVSLCCAFLVNIAVFHQRSYGVLLWTIFWVGTVSKVLYCCVFNFEISSIICDISAERSYITFGLCHRNVRLSSVCNA